ncbi:MAG: hypothetical protein JF599_01620 [Verrucomicrobia bacterium]|nr:hypothetical protein [Verrucomicrobiota bacterium]
MKLAAFLVTLVLSLAGCTAINTRVEKEHSLHLSACHHFFVVSNLNDNHGVDQSLVRVLESRGLEAESGPLTMLPDSAQAVITYDDKWAWDFSAHMVYLQIGAQDPQAVRPFAMVAYQKSVALSTQLDEVVGLLVDQLLKTAK